MKLSLRNFSICLYLVLVVFQIKTTNIFYSYSFPPVEIDRGIQRMNEYPPVSARLGYILNVKKEVQIVRKLEGNFFTTIDPTEYFPSRLPYIVAPLIFIGLYFFVKERSKRKLMFVGFIGTIVLLSILGPFAKYGPVLLYPFFILFVFISFQKIRGLFI